MDKSFLFSLIASRAEILVNNIHHPSRIERIEEIMRDLSELINNYFSQYKPKEKMKVYLVYKNSDMTEGRGPMIFDSVFLDKEKAENYIDGKLGVMGCKAIWSKEKYGDWEVREVEIED